MKNELNNLKRSLELSLQSQHIPVALVILGAVVLAFSYFKQEPTELHNNTAKEIIQTVRNSRAIPQSKSSIDTLRSAFTGKWFKNKPMPQESGTFDFTPPQNTRNNLEAKKEETKKKLAENKKKQDRKKKLQAFKASKKKKTYAKKGPSLFNFNYDDKGIPEFVYYPYNQNNPQNVPAAAGDENAKQWSVEELFALTQTNQSVSKLVQLYKSGAINAQIFYGVVDKLFGTPVSKNHEFGFAALSQTPSIASFSSHVSYLEEETTETVRVLATTQLELYKQIGNLPILNTALNNNEREVQSTSAVFLHQVADFLIQSVSSVIPGAGDERSPSSLTPQILERYRVILRQSANIMTTRLSSGTLDPELTAQYTQSKARIEQFLASQQQVNALAENFQY